MISETLKQHLLFWKRAFSLSQNIWDLRGVYFTSSGPYVEKDSSLIYVFRSDNVTIVAANQKNILLLSSERSHSSSDAFDEKIIGLKLGPTAKIFDDVDFYLPEESSEDWIVSIHHRTRRITIEDLPAVEELYNSCTEDDKDTTFPDLSNDVVWGLYFNESLVSLASYYQVPGTLVADISVVTGIPHRGQGYAEHVLRPLIKYSIDMGLFPRYRARQDNDATIKVAKRLGFLPYCSIQVFDPD